MNFFDLSFNLADSPLVGTLVGLILWSIFAVLALLVVEVACFIWLTVRGLRSIRQGKAATGKP